MPRRALRGGWRGVSRLAEEADMSVAELAGRLQCRHGCREHMSELIRPNHAVDGQEVNSQVKQADKAKAPPKASASFQPFIHSRSKI